MTIAEAIGAALAAALAPLLENLTQKSMNRNMVDTRGIGRPPSFDGSDKSWREWRGKMTAYLYATDDTAEDALKWVDLQGGAITIEALRASLTHNDGEVDEAGVERARAFSRKLYLILSDTCKGEPYRMVELDMASRPGGFCFAGMHPRRQVPSERCFRLCLR